MAEAVDWEDSATVSGKPVAPEDAWHVAVAHDDVKVVSLEQLDDMFRLSLVDAETRVWQPGMSEWVALGEVAGIEEAPPPPPKRSYPAPPSPRSAPPPPQRLAPPAPRSVAPNPFYAEPLKPVSHAAPVKPLPSFAPAAFAQTAPMTSVRPLVVSHNPYPLPRKGGGFGRFIVGLALLSGVGVSLYRNDVLRDAARSLHQEGLYAQLEQRLGGPSFGTVRSVEQSTASMGADALTLTSILGGGAHTAPVATSLNAALASDVSTPTPKPAETTANTTGSAPPVVSLESLGTEKGAKNEVQAALPQTGAPATAPVKPSVAASFVSTPKAAPAPKAEVAKLEKSEPKPVKAEKPAPPPPPAAPEKPESEMSPREKLNAAIAKSMSGSSSSSSKKKTMSTGLKSGGSEYDPLNPKL